MIWFLLWDPQIKIQLKKHFNQQSTVSRIWKKIPFFKYIFFFIKRHNIDFIDNMEKRTCSIKSFKFPFYFNFFSTLHQRTLKCYKDVSESTWKTKQEKTTSLSTDSGYRLVPRLKQETYCHGKQNKTDKKNKKKIKNSTLSPEKTKDLRKALMQNFKNIFFYFIFVQVTIRERQKNKKIQIVGHLLRLG